MANDYATIEINLSKIKEKQIAIFGGNALLWCCGTGLALPCSQSGTSRCFINLVSGSSGG